MRFRIFVFPNRNPAPNTRARYNSIDFISTHQTSTVSEIAPIRHTGRNVKWTGSPLLHGVGETWMQVAHCSMTMHLSDAQDHSAAVHFFVSSGLTHVANSTLCGEHVSMEKHQAADSALASSTTRSCADVLPHDQNITEKPTDHLGHSTKSCTALPRIS